MNRERFDDLPVDPDTADERSRVSPLGLVRDRWGVVAVIAAGGAIGGGLRWLTAAVVSADAGGFPWATLVANVLGCLLIGALVVMIIEVWPPRRYVRPFWAAGVLGGYTTFSAYTAETWALARDGAAVAAAGYLFGTLAAGLIATWLGMLATRTVVRTRVPGGPSDEMAG